MNLSESFWDNRSQQYDKSAQNRGEVYEKRLAALKLLLADTDDVLDLGCASGEISIDMAPFVRSVHGLDISGKMIELAQEKVRTRRINNVRFLKGDVFNGELDGLSISAITAFNVLHLVEDPTKDLNRLHEILPSGGLLITETPSLGKQGLFLRLAVGLAVKLKAMPSVHSFKTGELEMMISNSGFEIVESSIMHKKHGTNWIVGRKG